MQVARLAAEHVRAALAFHAMSDIAASNLSVGTYYAVYYLGQVGPYLSPIQDPI